MWRKKSWSECWEGENDGVQQQQEKEEAWREWVEVGRERVQILGLHLQRKSHGQGTQERDCYDRWNRKEKGGGGGEWWCLRAYWCTGRDLGMEGTRGGEESASEGRAQEK
jgi:hypothetical protein